MISFNPSLTAAKSSMGLEMGFGKDQVHTDDIEDRTDEQDRDPPEIITNLGICRLSRRSHDRSYDGDGGDLG